MAAWARRAVGCGWLHRWRAIGALALVVLLVSTAHADSFNAIRSMLFGHPRRVSLPGGPIGWLRSTSWPRWRNAGSLSRGSLASDASEAVAKRCPNCGDRAGAIAKSSAISTASTWNEPNWRKNATLSSAASAWPWRLSAAGNRPQVANFPKHAWCLPIWSVWWPCCGLMLTGWLPCGHAIPWPCVRPSARPGSARTKPRSRASSYGRAGEHGEPPVSRERSWRRATVQSSVRCGRWWLRLRPWAILPWPARPNLPRWCRSEGSQARHRAGDPARQRLLRAVNGWPEVARIRKVRAGPPDVALSDGTLTGPLAPISGAIQPGAPLPGGAPSLGLSIVSGIDQTVSAPVAGKVVFAAPCSRLRPAIDHRRGRGIMSYCPG